MERAAGGGSSPRSAAARAPCAGAPGPARPPGSGRAAPRGRGRGPAAERGWGPAAAGAEGLNRAAGSGVFSFADSAETAQQEPAALLLQLRRERL